MKTILSFFVTLFLATNAHAQTFVNGNFEGCSSALLGPGNFVEFIISANCPDMGFTFSGEGTAFYSNGSQGTSYTQNSGCYYYSPDPENGQRCVGLGNNVLISLQLSQTLTPGKCYSVTYNIINSTGDDGSGHPCTSSQPAQLSVGLSSSANSFGNLLATSSYIEASPYKWVQNTVTFTASQQSLNYVTLQLADQQNRNTIFFLDDFTIKEGCPLPVNFSNIGATIENNELFVNWTSETETNNDHFIIEISKDGKTWKEVATVKSKAADGNASSKIDYSYNAALGTVAGIFAIPALLGIGLAGFSRRRKIIMSLAVIALLAFGYSCSRKDTSSVGDAKQKIWMRIAQIDKDGTKRYSKIVEAVRQ